MSASAPAPPDRFANTGGRVLGGIALAGLAAYVLTVVLADDADLGLLPVLVVVALGTLLWAVMVRPMLRITREQLVLRNAFETVTIPLAAVEAVVVRAYLAVQVGDKRFTSTAVGRSLRQVFRDDHPGAPLTGIGMLFGGSGARHQPTESAGGPELSYGNRVEEIIRHRAADARDAAGVRLYSPEQQELARGVERRPALAEIGLLTVSVVAAVLVGVLR